MREQFIEKRFSPQSERLLKIADQIMGEYERMGYDLSLRQLYYQFVARNHIENSEKSYKNLGNLISDGRLAGVLDWDIIKDRARAVVTPSHWDSPAQILRAVAQQFRIDLWERQPARVVVMVEKQALEGVLIPVCRDEDVGFTANKGYSSSTALYELGKELNAWAEEQGQAVHVLYLGDHDPSGIDMTRDVRDRLDLFSQYTVASVKRLALNMDQVDQYEPPENPAKVTDSRYAAYTERFGESSWELDALEPGVLADLVRTAIQSLRDPEAWDVALAKQAAMRADLRRMSDDYVYREPEGGLERPSSGEPAASD